MNVEVGTNTVDGVLGGFVSLSTQDLEGSADFIQQLKLTIRPELKRTQEENEWWCSYLSM
jgi:AdoMet dependent proline di-methyltransferase